MDERTEILVAKHMKNNIAAKKRDLYEKTIMTQTHLRQDYIDELKV